MPIGRPVRIPARAVPKITPNAWRIRAANPEAAHSRAIAPSSPMARRPLIASVSCRVTTSRAGPASESGRTLVIPSMIVCCASRRSASTKPATEAANRASGGMDRSAAYVIEPAWVLTSSTSNRRNRSTG